MIYLCGCGKVKTGSPHRSSATKPWLCDACARKQVSKRTVDKTEASKKIEILRSFMTKAGMAKR